MSLFFKEGSQVSDYQNTAFFQNGEASKVSIFDNPPQSETQLAYELFNIDSINPRDTKERSIISKLDLLERDTEEFTQTPLHAEIKPISKRDPYMESQESKDSRMTFGGKFQNKLRESKAQPPKIYEGPPKNIEEKKESSKPKFLLGNRQKPNEPSSNFTHFRQAHPAREPESMPVKFDEIKPIAIPKPTFDCPSNSSSTFSIDFQEIRHRNQMEIKPIAKQVNSMRINNEKQAKDVRSDSGSSDRQSDKCSSDARLEMKDPQKEKKFGFNLRRSKVSDENRDNKFQSSFLLKNNPTPTANTFNVSLANPANHTPTHQNKAQNHKNEEKPASDQPMVTPFKFKTKDIAKDQPTEKVLLITSNVKKVDGERTSIFSRNPPQLKLNTQLQKSSKKRPLEREVRKTIEIRPKEEKHSDDSFNERQTSPLFDSNEPQSKEKRQSIGLKEQLKKLTSRPTEKVQLKSIAFNKGFKFKPRPAEEKMQAKSEETNQTKQNGSNFIIQKTAQTEQKNNNKSFMTFKEEKSEYATPKQSKSSEFSRYMLTLMELQQECEALKGRTVRSRNSYRELAILNDDINRRIDDIFKDSAKR